MTTVFEGNYFDGLSAKVNVVNVTIKQDRLVLHTQDYNVARIVNTVELSKAEFIGNNRVLIRLNNKTGELLDISSEDFVRDFKTAFPRISGKNFLEKIADSGWKGITAIVVLLMVLVVGLYFFVVPFFGEMSARFIPQQYEEQLGEVVYGNMIKTYIIDSAKTKLVNELLSEIDFQTPYNLKIVVVDVNQKNAFAMPGGHIIIYSGIIDEMEDYAELVGLLAHEVSHVNHRHSLRSIFRSLSSYIFISVLLNDVNGVTAVLVENVNSFKNLSYSRKLEAEADKEGLKILYHNQIDPNGMVKLFEVLMKEGDMPDQLEFLSSHPLTTKRIEYIEQQIEAADYTLTSNEKRDSVWENLKSIK